MRKKGVTLIELIAVIAIMTIVFTMVLNITTSTNKINKSLTTTNDMQNDINLTFTKIEKVVNDIKEIKLADVSGKFNDEKLDEKFDEIKANNDLPVCFIVPKKPITIASIECIGYILARKNVGTDNYELIRYYVYNNQDENKWETELIVNSKTRQSELTSAADDVINFFKDIFGKDDYKANNLTELKQKIDSKNYTNPEKLKEKIYKLRCPIVKTNDTEVNYSFEYSEKDKAIKYCLKLHEDDQYYYYDLSGITYVPYSLRKSDTFLNGISLASLNILKFKINRQDIEIKYDEKSKMLDVGICEKNGSIEKKQSQKFILVYMESEKMKKTKGAALILTICTIMLLTILTITVLSLATVQSKNIAIREKKQQAHYISESGVNLAIAKFNMGNSTFDAKVNYEYTIGQYNDLWNISNNKEKISITSIANNSKGISRQIDAILDTNKSAKNNVFGKTSLKYALSIVGDMKDEEPIKDINNDSSIKIDSQVFIQGAKVNLTLNNKFLPIDNGLNLKKRELVIKAKDVYIDDKKIFGIITMPTFPAFSNVYIDAPDISEIKFSGNHSSVSKSNIPIAKILKINSESIYGNKEDKTDGKYYEKTKTWSETLKINGSEMIGIYQKGKPIQFNEAIIKYLIR